MCTIWPQYTLYVWSYVYLCVFIEEVFTVSPVSDDNSSLWSPLRLREEGAPPSEAPLYCSTLFPHGSPYGYSNTAFSWVWWGGGYRISTAWFHSVLIHLRPLKLVVYECKTRRFVNYKHANVTICQNVVIKDLCTQQTVVTVRRTFQVFYCCNYLMRSKMKPLRTLN